jgi:hypothetical protein
MNDELTRVEEKWAAIVQRRYHAAADDFLADDRLLTSAGGASSRMPRADWIASLPSIQTEWRPSWRISVRLPES